MRLPESLEITDPAKDFFPISHSEIKLIPVPHNSQNRTIPLLWLGIGSQLLIEQTFKSSYCVPGTIPSTGDMQEKGGRNPCPHGADTLIGERDNKYRVSFKVANAVGNKYSK